MKLEMRIEVLDESMSTCSGMCPFIDGGHCDLFSASLDVTQLPEGIEWQDASCYTYERTRRCRSFG